MARNSITWGVVPADGIRQWDGELDGRTVARIVIPCDGSDSVAKLRVRNPEGTGGWFRFTLAYRGRRLDPVETLKRRAADLYFGVRS